MENPEVAQVFEEIADLLELQAANPFRVRAYRAAARTIRDLAEPVARIAADPERDLEDLPGIGKDLAGKITTILATGDLPLRRELRGQVSGGLRDLLNVPGLGPKRTLFLHDQLGVDSIGELREAARQHRIRGLKGFGAKSEQKVLEGLEQFEQVSHRTCLADADVYAESVLSYLRGTEGLTRMAVAGSIRRRNETIGDLDVLVTCSRPRKVMDRLAEYEGVAEVLARGGTKMSVRLNSGMQLDVRVVGDDSYGAALQYFTGSKQHNILLRRRAQELGLKINEYGVFRGTQRIAGNSEEEVYASVGLGWIPPELREGGREIEWAEQNRLPVLLELQDLRGDLHMHTTNTDGRATLEEMVTGARQLGYRYIAVTDHSKRVAMARGMDADGLRRQWKEIDRLRKQIRGMAIFKGVELDILEDGTLDLPDIVLREADWVVASIHYGQNQSRERITRRLLNAIRNPYVSAIGHPTGRLIGKRQAYDVDIETVLRAAADYGCMMELNCQPSRLDLNVPHLIAAKEHDIPIVISTDAHAVEELHLMKYGVSQARRAALEARDVANTLPLGQFRRLLARRRLASASH